MEQTLPAANSPLSAPLGAVNSIDLASSVPDLSLIGLFLQADMVVKLVMLLLAAASIWGWAIIFDKWQRLRRVKRQSDKFEEKFWSGGPLDSLYDHLSKQEKLDPMASLFVAGMKEWRYSAERGTSPPQGEVTQRVERVMQVTLDREMGVLERYMTFLASVGSTAPFIGLFGTVWGIMNSFQSIAASKNTSLAVVAPGIAEALFATAIGLVAAIPAVLAYNKFSSELARYGERLDNFVIEFNTILSRYLEGRERI
jgi:biopolymer transport protein TolQ